jgi:hypothetical protein
MSCAMQSTRLAPHGSFHRDPVRYVCMVWVVACSGCEENYHSEYNAVYSDESQPKFFGGTLLHLGICSTLVSCSAYSSTLNTEATCPTETSVNFQWTAPRYIPGGIILSIDLLQARITKVARMIGADSYTGLFSGNNQPWIPTMSATLCSLCSLLSLLQSMLITINRL